MTFLFFSQVSIYSPDYAAYGAIESIVHLCSTSVSEPLQKIQSFADLYKFVKDIKTEDPFLIFTKDQISNRIQKQIFDQEQGFDCYVSSLTNYQKCVSTCIQYEEFEQEMKNYDGLSDLSNSLETNFKMISQDIPGALLDAFGSNTQLCINSWTSLPFASRSLLKISVLKTSIFQDLSKCKWIEAKDILDLFSYSGQPLSGRPPVSTVETLLADIKGRVATHVKSGLLADPATYHSMSRDSMCNSRHHLTRNDITKACMMTWKLELQNSSEICLLNSFEQVENTAVELLKCRVEAFYEGKRTDYIGPMDCVPAGQPQQHADVIIARILEHIGHHRFIDVDSKLLVIVANETNVLPEVNLMELSSLCKESWISAKIINFAVQAHALRIGACCEMFPEPLTDGPKIYYACSWFYSLCVMGTTPWTAGTDWDWLIAPTFVDAGHFITLAISFVKKKIAALDSFGIPRDSFLSNMQKWALLQGVDATKENGWILENMTCPQQGNAFDCAIFTILNSTYLPACKTNSFELSRYYGQQSTDSMRGWLADSIYRSGERFRLHKWNLL